MAVQKKFALGRGLDALISNERSKNFRIIIHQRNRTGQNICKPQPASS